MPNLGLKRWQTQVLALVVLAQLALTASTYTSGGSPLSNQTVALQVFGLAATGAVFLAWNAISPRLSKLRRRARFSRFWSKKAAPIIAYGSLALGIIAVLLQPGITDAIGIAFVGALPAFIIGGTIIQALLNALDFLGV